MKNLLYLFVCAFMAFSVQSCKRIGDEDGNLLNDMDANQPGLHGPRFLYREVMGGIVMNEYKYDLLKVVEVKNQNETTTISYSGDRIYKIDYDGNDGTDRTVYTRFFNYAPNSDVVTSITENETFHPDFLQTTPPPVQKRKALYTLTYVADKKLEKIEMKQGPDVVGVPFEYTNYSTAEYFYDAENKNVTKVDMKYGGIVAGVFSPPAELMTYNYMDYDDKKTPYSLLPFEYLVSVTLDNPYLNYYHSENNPKRTSSNNYFDPIQYAGTLYTYDPQGYALTGFGYDFDYRPF